MSTPVPPSYGAAPVTGTQPAQPTTAAWTPGMARPMSEDDTKLWQSRVDRAVSKRKLFEPQWQRALDRYAKPLVNDPKGTEKINALLDYRHVESKKAQLFHRTPEINLVPIDPVNPEAPVQMILPLREKVLNYELGPERANAKRALHQTLIDTLAASGWMAVEIGYEQVTLKDPLTQMDVPVWSRRFISPIPSKRLLVPDDWYSTVFDEAPWLGVQGTISREEAARHGWVIPEDVNGTVTKNDQIFTQGPEVDPSSDPLFAYTKIYYRASRYDAAVFNPELFRCLVLIDGMETPAKHADSAYQAIDERGQLTDDSMVGNPIHVDTIRDLIDSAYVPCDLVVGEQLSEELNNFRTGQMRTRRRRRPVTLVNQALGEAIIEKIAANAGPVPVDEQFLLDNGARAMVVTQSATEPRDNYEAQRMIEHDWQSAIGTGENQGGQISSKKTTATEVRTVQGNSAARARTDEDRVREYAVRLVRKFDALVTRTMTPQDVTKILGQQGALVWDQWKALPGKYTYTIQPDAGRYLDANEYRTQKVNEYNLLRKDPLVNGAELTREVATALGYDALKMVPQDAVEEKPEPPKISISFSAEQAMLSPAEAQLMLDLLEQSGYKIDPNMRTQLMATAVLRAQVAAATPSPEHGGPAQKTERIDKRQESRTGGIEGVGKVA